MKKMMGLLKKVMVKDQGERMLNEIKEKATQLGVVCTYEELLVTSGRFEIAATRDLDTSLVTIDSLTIKVGLAMSAMEEVMTIAHELGHVWQFLGECDGEYEEWFLYREVNSVLLIEEDAWLRAVRILSEIGFESWIVFEQFAFRKFGTYLIKEYKDEKRARRHLEKFADNLRSEIGKAVSYALV